MQKQPLIFSRLSILRMPGLPRGLPDYIDFAAHINIIIGPNASGKSSTARAIKELIWRHASGEVTAHALTNLGGEDWELKLDGRKASSRRNGEDAPMTGIPALEGSGRYTLALHELVTAKDGDLARQVIKDSTGYDLDAAQQTLRYSAGSNSPRTNVYKDFIAAKNAYDEIFKGQYHLQGQQSHLARLTQEKVNAEQATTLMDWNRQLLEFARIKQSLADAQKALSTEPQILEALSGEEYNDLQDTKNQLAVLATQIKDLEDTIADAERRRTALNLPQAGLPDTLLEELDMKITALADLEKHLRDNEEEIAAALGQEQAALKPLGAVEHISEWVGLSWVEVDALEDHLQKVHSLLSHKAAVEALIAELRHSVGQDAIYKPADVIAAIRTLTAWLQEFKSEETKTVPGWSLWMIVLLAALSAIGVLIFGIIGLIGIVIIVGVAAIIYFSRKKRGDGAGEIRRTDYNKIGLSEPSQWVVASVQKRLEELVDQLGYSSWQQRVDDRVKIHEHELEALKPDLEAMDEQYKILKNRLMFIPTSPSGDIKSYDAMYWFLRYAREWHDRYTVRLALERARGVLVIQLDAAFVEINRIFAIANIDSVTDVVSAKVFLQQLEKNDRRWREAGIEIQNARKGIENLDSRNAQLTTKLQEIYTKVNVEAGAEDKVNELILQLPGYTKKKEICRDLAMLLTEKERVLGEHALYLSYGTELDELTIAMIEERMPALRTQASGLEQIRTEIATINARIDLAQKGNSLEMSLKEKDERLADLEEMYDTNLAAVTGKLIIDALKKRADDRDRPPVFRRANAIFNRITNGKYQLRLNSEEPPTFGAFDNVEGQWRNLEELSTGTRIQLLLSVRLAFIDSLESSVSVPIVADELLANSDSRRASAIVDALAEISREGRQIFYFTSKEDEVAKWHEFLADKLDITRAVFVLDGHDSEGYTTTHIPTAPEFAGGHLLNAVPEVGDKDHAQYGEVLELGEFDLMSDLPDRLHIWYLFDDPQIVRAVLKKGINYWGQLRNYFSSGGSLDGLNAVLLEQIGIKIGIFERFQELFQKGRPRRINRSVLENSGAVTQNFIDAVMEKSEEFGHDPLRLLDSLENRGVPGFRANSIERLRDYLLAEGHISEETELSATDIWIQLSAYISQSPVTFEDAQRFIARILNE